MAAFKLIELDNLLLPQRAVAGDEGSALRHGLATLRERAVAEWRGDEAAADAVPVVESGWR